MREICLHLAHLHVGVLLSFSGHMRSVSINSGHEDTLRPIREQLRVQVRAVLSFRRFDGSS